MKILAIETSCDETAVAVLDVSPGTKNPGFKILSNIVSSQVKLHAPYGGVVPSLAMREHYRNITTCFEQALNEAYGKKKKEFDVVAVTIGPGLEPALWVGINFAKSIALAANKPIIGINHLEGHLYANWLSSKSKNIVFPALGLIVSGGHTELVVMKNHGNYKLIGATRDDAAGEAFDKVAKLLGLGYPGGPVISRIAEEYETESKNSKFQISNFKTNPKSQILNSKTQITLPRPMMNSKDYDFSFSGLKTAVLYLVKDLTKKYSLEQITPSVAKEFQDSVIDVLIAKTLRAAKEYKVKTILMGGGVTANKKLRTKMTETVEKELPNVPLFIPDLKFSVDNAAMIGIVAYFHANKKRFTMPEKLKANGTLRLN